MAVKTIEQQRLAEPHHKILVALSGGADSTALVITMKELGFEVVAAHIDHGIRAGSDEDAVVCARTCRRLGVELLFERLHLDTATEVAARDARYAALERMQALTHADRIAVGHTKNDQAETVQMRLERGGFGLGMPYRRGDIIRPLLDVSREQTEAVCREAGTPYVQDPTNQDTSLTRNRIRKDLSVDPVRASKLIDIGFDARAAADQMQARVDESFLRLVDDSQELLRVESEGLRALRDAEANALLRRVIERAGGVPSTAAIAQILDHVVHRTGARTSIGLGAEVCNEGLWLTAGHQPGPVQLPRLDLVAPSSKSSREWAIEVVLEFVDRPKHPGPKHPWPKHPSTDDPFEETFDLNGWTEPLAIRPFAEGDRIQPLGMTGTTKLQDVFTDLKIPKSRRPTVPLFCCGDRILWIVGHKRSELAKLTDQTTRALKVRVLPRPELHD